MTLSAEDQVLPALLCLPHLQAVVLHHEPPPQPAHGDQPNSAVAVYPQPLPMLKSSL